MKTKNSIFYPYFMLVYAVIGIAIAAYDCYMIYTGQLLWCPPPIDGCNTVAYSPYGRIYGLPIRLFGLVFYLIMFAIVALLAFNSSSRRLRIAVLLYTVIGVCGSVGFMYLDIAFIHAFCVYCLISAILTLLLLISAIVHFRAPADGYRVTANKG